MTFDYKKEYKEFYMPKGTPSIVTVPKMNYIAVRGSGNPNDADGEYKQAIGLLYGIAFTIKMSKKEDHQIDGYFDYVVPPLEGFWWQGGGIRGTPCCEPTEPAGETAYPELIMLVRKILSGFLLFACQILLPGRISTGLSGKLRQRKNRIFLRLSFFPMRRAYVYSVCISERMTMSLLR